MAVPKLIYADEWVTLYHGNCLECEEWLSADVLVTDPPYGIGWRRGSGTGDKLTGGGRSAPGHSGIANDQDTSVRDAALKLWGSKPALVFGSFDAPPPENRKQTLVWRKWANSGVIGSTTGWRRDVEPIFVCGDWEKRTVRWSSLLIANGTSGGKGSAASRYDHPHAKPDDIMTPLIEACPPGVIADPFAGSGSTLIAARELGHKSIGVELERSYIDRILNRIAEGNLFIQGSV